LRRFLLETVRDKRSQRKVKNTEAIEAYEFFLKAAVFNFNVGFTTLAKDLEREVLDI
jgi:hypothetical protein